MKQLEGSCHCGSVKFRVQSRTPYPFMYCYCSVCVKVAGSGCGGCCNLMADSTTLDVYQGAEHLAIYRAVSEGKPVENLRHFCRMCGAHLYAWAPKYAQSLYPFASAIDTPLPEPPERYHIMLGSKPNWVEPPPADKLNHHFDKYPDIEGIEKWHEQHGLLCD